MKKLLGIIIVIAIIGGGVWYVTSQNDQKQLTVLSWDYYIGPETIANFEKEFDAKVTYELIKSNEEALARIKANPATYDIAVVSDYMVDILRSEKGLERIDKGAVANADNIGEAFRGNYFDPTDSLSVPYAYGTTGFAVNSKYYSGTTISWKELTKPEYNGKIGIIDDMRYVIGSVLMELGYSPNTTSQKEIDEAVALLKQVMPNVLKFTDASPVDLMVNESAWISYGWSGDSLQMKAENEAINYMLPTYGGLKFLDNMIIPKGAPHNELAQVWINYILRPDVSAAITDEVQYGNPNAEAFDLITQDVRLSPAVFPSPDVLKKLQYVQDVGEQIDMYNKAWESVKQ